MKLAGYYIFTLGLMWILGACNPKARSCNCPLQYLRSEQGEYPREAQRRSSGGYPLDRLYLNDGQRSSTCQALGFGENVHLGSCSFGRRSSEGYSDCGFTNSHYFRYGNKCEGCKLNDGDIYPAYIRQGPMNKARVITSASGSVKTRCKIRTTGANILPCGKQEQVVETVVKALSDFYRSGDGQIDLPIMMVTQINAYDATVCDIWALQTINVEQRPPIPIAK